MSIIINFNVKLNSVAKLKAGNDSPMSTGKNEWEIFFAH
jgi:hypothetical protein